MEKSGKRFFAALVSLVGVTMLVAGCGQTTANTGSGSTGGNGASANSTSSSNSSGSTGGSAQLTQINFATLPIADSALVALAQKDGIFQQNGLNVKLSIMQTGPATTSAVVSGAAQFSQSNYATLFSARSKGVKLDIVADAADAESGFSYVVTGANSSIKSPKDLVGKRIATSVIGGIGPVAIDYWLKQKGIDYSTIKWVQMPFQDMEAALQRHQVDAAWVVEPFSTQLTQKYHDRVVFDVFSGPTAGMPVAAYATTEAYAKSHPQIVAEFRKSIEEAAAKVQGNTAAIVNILPTYTALSASLASQIHLESYPSTMDVNKIDEVATAMKATGFLSQSFDPSVMIDSGSN